MKTPLLRTLAKEGKKPKPLTAKELKQTQQWIDDDWESHDIDREAVCLIRRLLLTIDGKRT